MDIIFTTIITFTVIFCIWSIFFCYPISKKYKLNKFIAVISFILFPFNILIYAYIDKKGKEQTINWLKEPKILWVALLISTILNSIASTDKSDIFAVTLGLASLILGLFILISDLIKKNIIKK